MEFIFVQYKCVMMIMLYALSVLYFLYNKWYNHFLHTKMIGGSFKNCSFMMNIQLSLPFSQAKCQQGKYIIEQLGI